MSEMLYLQTERNIKITSPVVTLGDVAQLSCSDGAVLARNQVRRVAHLPDDGYGRYVCSASTLVRLVTEAEEHVDVTHIGEPNFILTYEDPRQKNTWISWCKTILVGILTFIGTAFSIMTFHTDIGVRELFLDVYTRFLPQMTPGFSVLEISYSIGIGLGVVLYFNHFGRRKFTQDPTPLEVEMRVYEDDIDTTIIEQNDRSGKGKELFMRILPEILLITAGLSLGFFIASGLIALVIGLGIVTRYAGITKTAGSLRFYECCCMAGALFGDLFSLGTFSFSLPSWTAGVFWLFAGIYLGSWIIALGEVVNLFSILCRRIGLTRGLPFVILCMAAGKIAGSLYYFANGFQ